MWYKCKWLLEQHVSDATAFIATCVCVSVGLNRLATVWNSDPSACCVTYFDCIIVTVSRWLMHLMLNKAECKHSLRQCSCHNGHVYDLWCQQQWTTYLENRIPSDCISSVTHLTEIKCGFSHPGVFVFCSSALWGTWFFIFCATSLCLTFVLIL